MRLPGKCAECRFDIPPGTVCRYGDKEFCTDTCRQNWHLKRTRARRCNKCGNDGDFCVCRRCRYCKEPLDDANPAAYCDEICHRTHKTKDELNQVQRLAFNLVPPKGVWGANRRRRSE